MIRGKNVNKALAILQYTNKRATDGIEKCVRSAIANASEAAEKANIAIDPDELWVKACFVDRGPTKGRRRMRPAPQGRAYREQRHFCHVTVLLSSDEPVTAAESKTKATDAKAAKPAESKSRKRGGAAAAPRAKSTAPKAEGKKAASKKVQPAESKKSEAPDETTGATEDSAE
jgi:large subunit ribosomal protein L22